MRANVDSYSDWSRPISGPNPILRRRGPFKLLTVRSEIPELKYYEVQQIRILGPKPISHWRSGAFRNRRSVCSNRPEPNHYKGEHKVISGPQGPLGLLIVRSDSRSRNIIKSRLNGTSGLQTLCMTKPLMRTCRNDEPEIIKKQSIEGCRVRRTIASQEAVITPISWTRSHYRKGCKRYQVHKGVGGWCQVVIAITERMDPPISIEAGE